MAGAIMMTKRAAQLHEKSEAAWRVYMTANSALSDAWADNTRHGEIPALAKTLQARLKDWKQADADFRAVSRNP
jgi:hypothetical protein